MPELADRDLDARVAVELFGWRWYLLPARNRVALYPPVDSGWTRHNYHAEFQEIGKSDQGHARFSDWDRLAACYRVDGVESAERSVPHYSTDIAAAWKVVETVKAKGEEAVKLFMFAIEGQSYQYQFYTLVTRPLEWLLIHCSNPARAICEAALATLAEADNA